MSLRTRESTNYRVLVVQCDAPAMNLNLYGFLCCLEIQYMTGIVLSLSVTLILKSSFNISTCSLTISSRLSLTGLIARNNFANSEYFLANLWAYVMARCLSVCLSVCHSVVNNLCPRPLWRHAWMDFIHVVHNHHPMMRSWCTCSRYLIQCCIADLRSSSVLAAFTFARHAWMDSIHVDDDHHLW